MSPTCPIDPRRIDAARPAAGDAAPATGRPRSPR